jgi:type I restriction enzyme, R subunit
MSELLEKTLREYRDRIITAADVVHMMVKLRNELQSEVHKRQNLGLSEEEISFYEIIGQYEGAIVYK